MAARGEDSSKRRNPAATRRFFALGDGTAATRLLHAPDNLAMFHGTTILCVRRDGRVVLGGDGQVTLDKTVMKASAR
ncbi:MAG TPA: hypothetical protein VFI53_12295, partial [Myxococcaceae bacterium]|nr:hypothetical protein [Myxococcaceae bacterium]